MKSRVLAQVLVMQVRGKNILNHFFLKVKVHSQQRRPQEAIQVLPLGCGNLTK